MACPLLGEFFRSNPSLYSELTPLGRIMNIGLMLLFSLFGFLPAWFAVRVHDCIVAIAASFRISKGQLLISASGAFLHDPDRLGRFLLLARKTAFSPPQGDALILGKPKDGAGRPPPPPEVPPSEVPPPSRKRTQKPLRKQMMEQAGTDGQARPADKTSARPTSPTSSPSSRRIHPTQAADVDAMSPRTLAVTTPSLLHRDRRRRSLRPRVRGSPPNPLLRPTSASSATSTTPARAHRPVSPPRSKTPAAERRFGKTALGVPATKPRRSTVPLADDPYARWACRHRRGRGLGPRVAADGRSEPAASSSWAWGWVGDRPARPRRDRQRCGPSSAAVDRFYLKITPDERIFGILRRDRDEFAFVIDTRTASSSSF